MSRLPIENNLRSLAMNETPLTARDDDNDEKNDHKSATDPEHQVPTLNGDDESAIEQDDGVTRIEALYLVYGKGWGLYALWASIGLISYVYALSGSTTYYYAQFATSAYGEHTIIGTIGVITQIMNGVAQPFIAKIADLWARPHALCVAVILYAVGYAMCAGSNNVATVVAGQVIYTLGNSGISFLNSLLISDITSLQWRAFVIGCTYLPFVLNAFIAGYITTGVGGFSANGWRWGYGMFCILVPVAISPALIVLFIGDYRAKKLGALSLASSSYARRQILAGRAYEKSQRTYLQSFLHYWRRMNGTGLLLMGFGFALILTPITLSTSAKGGYTNPSLIAMLVIGGCSFIGWGVWDGYFAQYPIMPKRVLNRTFMACVAIDFFYYFSGYFMDAYFGSWVFIIKDWSSWDYTTYMNTLTVGLCGFAIIVGVIMRYTHRYKVLQLTGLAIRCVGVACIYRSSIDPTDAALVCGRVFISIGGAISVTASTVATQASVPHQDMAIAVAVLNLWTSVGGSIATAISASVWNKRVPAKLAEYLGPDYNQTAIAEIFADINVAKIAEPRDVIKLAYQDAIHPLFLAALVTSFGGLLAGFFASNFYLSEAHNAIETHKIIKWRGQDETNPEVIAAKAREVEEKILQAKAAGSAGGAAPLAEGETQAPQAPQSKRSRFLSFMSGGTN